MKRRRLAFVSTRFLFPADSGGKIRTTQILRGMKGGSYEITLLCPITKEERLQYAEEIKTVCDHFEPWPAPNRRKAFRYTRLRHVVGDRPIPVVTDWNRVAYDLIQRTLRTEPHVAVFDFAHAAVLAPSTLPLPTVLFTHNVEAEIFARHRDTARNPLMRMLWENQRRKMARFERDNLRRFTVVVAVSDRDADYFKREYGLRGACVIPTGVDLDFFSYRPPAKDHQIVFCGSMDWLANQDAVEFFLDDVWPHIASELPQARISVVGRAPPPRLLRKAAQIGDRCQFTGYVDDIRPHVSGAAVSVIPLRIGGGTRLKAYEAMAMGTPLVSTAIGVEGLPLVEGEHYLRADSAEDFAAATVRLMRSPEERRHIAENARRFVEEKFSYTVAAQAFEAACDLAIAKHAAA